MTATPRRTLDFAEQRSLILGSLQNVKKTTNLGNLDLDRLEELMLDLEHIEEAAKTARRLVSEEFTARRIGNV